jgi:hypothetical protein
MKEGDLYLTLHACKYIVLHVPMITPIYIYYIYKYMKTKLLYIYISLICNIFRNKLESNPKQS